MQLDTEITGNETEVENAPVTDDAIEATEEVSTENEAEKVGDDTDDGGDISKEMKTIKKALNKKNRYIDNQRAKIRSLEAQMQQLKSQPQTKTEAPNMEKFESVLDYMKADQSYNLEQKLAEQAQQHQLANLQAQQNMVREQQEQAITEVVSEMLNSNSDFRDVVTKNAHTIQNMPPHIEALMYEIDNAPAATYALAKEGKLQDLYYMPPHLAAAHLVQAEIRGQQYLQQSTRPPKQAPEPIGSLKGTGKPSKTMSTMTPDEIVKRYIK